MTTNKPKKIYKSFEEFLSNQAGVELLTKLNTSLMGLTWQACSDSKNAEIEAKDARIDKLENDIHDILMECYKTNRVGEIVEYIFETNPHLKELNQGKKDELIHLHDKK